ncbi:hypothetical protein CGGC5_v014904 [Colletotrichum fructicola Nara gc5]|uniref:Uncharacterized protein n=1 Tax=Colletotrichum fructicola (strain Nara gc5) TaxID=1213859 RepID=A0A7J6IIS2_COLFN|nr:hypothetical protein CGGC5_v014904 [Colletotrichum fructicola Nara gc5]
MTGESRGKRGSVWTTGKRSVGTPQAEVMAMGMESIPFDHADDGLHLSFDALADAAAAVLPSRRVVGCSAS